MWDKGFEQVITSRIFPCLQVGDRSLGRLKMDSNRPPDVGAMVGADLLYVVGGMEHSLLKTVLLGVEN
jgi:hypothetical protein